MTKEQFKETYRQQRIAKSREFEERIQRVVSGEATDVFDNSHIWKTREEVRKKVDPIIAANQRAWANATYIAIVP